MRFLSVVYIFFFMSCVLIISCISILFYTTLYPTKPPNVPTTPALIFFFQQYLNQYLVQHNIFYTANEHLEKVEENSRDAHREYLDAKNLLLRVRQSSGASVPPMNIALDDSSVEDILGIISKKKDATTNGGKSPGRKSQKFPYIEDILVSLAKSGELHKGTKLSSAECHLVNKKDNSQYVYTMQLVEELWTEEEELFLRSSREEIEESLEEATIIAETISLRCLTKLNEFEGREDPTPTNHQKPSFVSVGNRARRVFLGRKKGDENLV